MKTLYKLLAIAMILGLAFTALPAALVQAEGTVIYVSTLAPSWDAEGGGGVFSAYIPTENDYVSPGTTALYAGREAGIIKAGLTPKTDGHYDDEGLFGIKPNMTINALATGPFNFDVVTQEGTNPVWMTIEIDTGTVGDRNDNTTYQYVPTTNPSGWHTVDGLTGLWQKWNDNMGGTASNPLLPLGDLVTAYNGLNVTRVYLRLGMGDSYHGSGNGTIAWVDKINLHGVTYDFVVSKWYVSQGGSDSNLGTEASPFATIQHAVAVASDGDDIILSGTVVVPSAVIFNKSVRLTCEVGSLIQVSGTGDRFDLAANGASIEGCSIEKTDKAGEQNIIRIRASNVSIKNNTIWGKWSISDGDVTRAMVINAGNFTGLEISGNTIHDLRQPAYVSGTHTGTVSNNYVYGTKGWVLEGGNLTFTGNTFSGNVGDIAILSVVPAAYYTDILAISAANDNAVVEDQRLSPALLSVAYVDDSAASGGNGTEATPLQTITAGINRVVAGGTVYVAAGTYTEENILITKGLTLQGSGSASTFIEPSTITNNSTIVVQNPSGDVKIDGFTFTMTPKIKYGSAVLVSGTAIPVDSSTVTISNNVVNGSNDGTKSDFGFYGQGNHAKLVITNNIINKTGDNPIVMEQQIGSTTVSNNTFYITDSPDYDAYFSMAYDGKTITTPQIVQNNTFYLDHSGTGYSEAITFDTAVLNSWNGITTDTGHYSNVQIKDNLIYTGGAYARGIGLVDLSSGAGNGTITGATITGNQIIGESVTDTATYGLILRGDIKDSTIKNNKVEKIDLGIWVRPGLSLTVFPSNNDISNNHISPVNVAVKNDCTAGTVDASPNWWGSPLGPTSAQVYGSVTTAPWCADPSCETFAPDESGVVELAGEITTDGGLEVNIPNLTIHLAGDTIIQNSSPCFVITADNTRIVAEPGAKCIPTGGSNGIDVAAGITGVTVDGLEIDGSAQSTGDGIAFAGAVTDVVLVDNFIHDLDSDGISFAAAPAGVVDIHGNLFMNNTGNGIEAGTFAVPAEYNSWGSADGAVAGDDISDGVDADPYTHVDLYLVPSGTPVNNKVVVGNTIKYDVKAHLVNVNAADFVLTYDATLLSLEDLVVGLDFVGLPTGSGTYAALVDTSVAGQLHFRGVKLNQETVTGDVTLFTVTFKANASGTSALNFDETTDEFGMPAVGSSENVYAAALTDGSVTVLEALNVTAISLSESVDQTSWTPLYGNLVDGYTMVIDPKNTFEYVDVTSLTANRLLADGIYPFYLSQTGLSAKFWAYWAAQGVTEGKTGWTIITGTAPIFTLVVSGSGTEFALMDGMYPLQLARVSGDYPTGAYNFTGTVNDTFGGKANAAVKITYVKAPTLDSTDIQGYYLTGDAQDFHVTVSNPSDGGTFGSTIDYIFTITGAVKADVTSLVCPSFAETTNLIPLFTESGGNLTGSMATIMGTIYPGFTGFPMTAGTDYVNTCTITFATAKSYPFTVSMVDQAVSPANLLATMTKTAIVYTKPVISSTTLAGPYQTNNDQDFSLSITNPSSIPGPFDLHFNFPAGTVLVYGGNTYPCDSTGCTVPVLLPAASNDLTFTVTLVAPFSGSVTVDLNDSDWTPADRLLATLTQTVVSLPNFTVTGTVSMQGRSTRAGVPMTLAGLFPVNTATSIEQISNNLIFSNVAEGTYTVSTNQPRYLNVAGISVEIKAGKVTLNRLELKGGNAKWTDNSIDILDAVLVGTTFGSTGSSYDGDVNFDGKVSIQDLALVGGNYGLTSAFAYVGVWVP